PDAGAIAAQVEAARAAVAARPCGVDTSNAVSEAPPGLEDHVATLQAHPILARSFEEGWDVRMVDLTKLSPVQGYVFSDHPLNPVLAGVATDPLSLAAVTLPVPADVDLPFQFVPEKRAWVFTSEDLNLRATRDFHAKIGPGVGTFGFLVCMAPSVLRVAAYANRLVLVDGNHRAFGLLRRGIDRVPALFKRHSSWPQLPDSSAMLSQATLLGDRPPYLSDFLKPEHYTLVSLPVTRRVVMIQATDLSLVA
ncbi:MAG: hypothetical protein WAM82_29235, partial [Thermoanaerobaculia bacterium]